MNHSFRTTTFFILFFLFGSHLFAQKTDGIKMPLTEKYWTATAGNVEFVEYKSIRAARGVDNNFFEIMLNDFEFTNGTIEYDVELIGTGFPGITFRIDSDTLNSEIFYLRHFGKPDPLRRTAMQYAAVIDGVNLWDVTDDYQASATIFEKKWNHVKLVISDNQLKAYVNDMEHPSLHVPVLEGITKKGRIALSGNVVYANVVIHPDVTEELPNQPGYDPTKNDPRYLRNWEVSQPIDFPFGRSIMKGINTRSGVVIDSTLLNQSTSWQPIYSHHRALINLTKVYGATADNQRRLVWLKTTIYSESAQKKIMRLGFRDEVWVFVNRQPLFFDKNYFGSPGMKDPMGRCSLDNTSFQLPLKEGENEVLIGLSNHFFAWGIIARFDDNTGLKY